jgi:hypothetical protein
MRCLRRSSVDRFASVADLAAALAPHGSSSARASLERIGRPRAAPVAPPRTVQVRPVEGGLATHHGTADLGSGDTVLALTPPSGSSPAFESGAIGAPRVLTTSSWSRSEKQGGLRRRRVVGIVSAIGALGLGTVAIGMLWGRTSSPPVVVAPPAVLVGTVAPPPVETSIAPSAQPEVSTASASPPAASVSAKVPTPLRRPPVFRPAPSGPPSLQDPIFGRH